MDAAAGAGLRWLRRREALEREFMVKVPYRTEQNNVWLLASEV